MRRSRGFTLIELLVGMVVLAIITSVALPSYSSYIKRSKVPPGLDALSAYATRMEQRYQDTGNYGTGSCAVAFPSTGPANFTMTCTLTNSGQGFLATANGSDTLSGYSYTIDQNGTRRTTSHPSGVPSAACWSTKGKVCDA